MKQHEKAVKWLAFIIRQGWQAAELAKHVLAVTAGDCRHESILTYMDEAKVKTYVILDDFADKFPCDCV